MRLNNGKHQKSGSGAQNGGPLTNASGVGAAQRFVAPLEHLSGGQNLSYREQKKSVKWVQADLEEESG